MRSPPRARLAGWIWVSAMKTRQTSDGAAHRDHFAITPRSPHDYLAITLQSPGASFRTARRQGLIAAACSRLDQFTGSWPVLELGIPGELEVDQRRQRAGLVEF